MHLQAGSWSPVIVRQPAPSCTQAWGGHVSRRLHTERPSSSCPAPWQDHLQTDPLHLTCQSPGDWQPVKGASDGTGTACPASDSSLVLSSAPGPGPELPYQLPPTDRVCLTVGGTCSPPQLSGSAPRHCPPAAAEWAAQHQPAKPSLHPLQAVDGQPCGSRPRQPQSGRTGALFSAQSEYTREFPEKPLIQQRAVQPGHFELQPVPAVSLETSHGEPRLWQIKACGQLRDTSRCQGAGQSSGLDAMSAAQPAVSRDRIRVPHRLGKARPVTASPLRLPQAQSGP